MTKTVFTLKYAKKKRINK